MRLIKQNAAEAAQKARLTSGKEAAEKAAREMTAVGAEVKNEDYMKKVAPTSRHAHPSTPAIYIRPSHPTKKVRLSHSSSRTPFTPTYAHSHPQVTKTGATMLDPTGRKTHFHPSPFANLHTTYTVNMHNPHPHPLMHLPF